ncbi:MAG: hypothetical protein ACRDMJ_04120 [Solirubrobacteraceae bacterium]
MGRRERQRRRADRSGADAAVERAPGSEYRGEDGGVLVLRGSLTPAARREYAETLAGGLDREDARQRAIELLFERLAVSWTIAGVCSVRQRELLGRYRMASTAERDWVLRALREHVAEHFPEMAAP